MSVSKDVLQDVVNKGETSNGSIEFKESLTIDSHWLIKESRDSLAAQMKHRILSGEGSATYVIGVTDSGELKGISKDSLDETIKILSSISAEVSAEIEEINKWEVENTDRFVGLVKIIEDSAPNSDSNQIVVGTAGHVDHGKSTLVGSLITGTEDDGKGDLRQHLDVKPHEIDRGLSADLSYSVYGFNSSNEPLRLRDPNQTREKSDLVEKADKLVSFVDTVGHQPWLRTAIRGLVGQRIDYGLLVVSAEDGPTQTTKEHLGVLLAMDLPTIITITKADLVSQEQLETVEKDIEALLRGVGCTGLSGERYQYETLRDEIDSKTAPILRTSAVTREGLDTLDKLFSELPKTRLGTQNETFQMYIDTTYLVEGVGTVVSGTIKSGTLEQGDTVYLGPTQDGEYIKTKARSIEIHYHSVDKAEPGELISVALQNISEDQVERGMMISKEQPKVVTEFEAEVMILNHPTKVSTGYEPVIHIETISESIVLEPDDPPLLPGEKGTINAKFKFNPYAISEGQKFVFREGKSKGVGKITNIPDKN